MSGLREAFHEVAADVPVYGDLARAIEQADRERSSRFGVVAALAAAAVVVAVLVGVLAVGRDANDSLQPVGPPPTVEDSAGSPDCSYDDSPSCQAAFDRRLDAILGNAPGWAVDVSLPPDGVPLDFVINGPCEGNWGLDSATGGGHGSAGTAEADLAQGLYHARWPSKDQASDAADRLVENLASCDETAWRTKPIAQRPGAVLATSAQAVVWIQQSRVDVWVLQVLSTDGAPPPDVQAEVAAWMVDYIDWKWVD